MKTTKIILVTIAIFLSFLLFSAYLYYKNNPLKYLVLTKKYQIISHLLFKRDDPNMINSLRCIDLEESCYSIEYVTSDDYDRYYENNTFISIDGIKDVYKTEIPKKLRKIFDLYTQIDLSNKENYQKIKSIKATYGLKKYINLFPEKFIVKGFNKFKGNDVSCGKNAYLVNIYINPSALEAWNIKLTEKFEICEIYNFPYDLSREKYEYKRKYIKKDKYKDYWI